jgi:hypothetical protein
LIRDFKTRDLLDRNLARNTKREKPTEHALVRAHDEAEVLPLLESLKERQEIRKLEERMALVDEENLRHEWRAFVIDSDSGKIAEHFEPNVCFRIVYSKEWGRGGRMYSWSALSAQQIPKAARRVMLIDSETVEELDFSCFATRMLYRLEKEDPPGDVYRPERSFPRCYATLSKKEKEVVRDFVKKVTIICWNTGSRSAANSATGAELAKLANSNPAHWRIRRRAMRDNQTSIPGIVGLEKKAHLRLAHRFFTEVGVDLMTTDGKMMLAILERITSHGKPALGIHDSVVCKQSDAPFVREVMVSVYRSFFGFGPVIKNDVDLNA